MFALLGRLSTVHPRPVCLGPIVLPPLALLTPPWDAHRRDNAAQFPPERCDSVRGQRLLQQSFPGVADGSQLVLALEHDQPLGPEDVRRAGQLRDELATQGLGRVAPVLDQVDDRLVLIRVGLDTPPRTAATRQSLDRIETLARARLTGLAAGPRLGLAGSAVLGRDTDRSAIWTNVGPITLLVGILALALLLTYRAPLLALGGATAAAGATAVALKVISLMTRLDDTSLLGVSQPAAGVLFFGLVAVATLVFIRRVREELVAGRNLTQSLVRTVTLLGPGLLVSAGVLGGGWLLLGFAEYGRLRATGLG